MVETTCPLSTTVLSCAIMLGKGVTQDGLTMPYDARYDALSSISVAGSAVVPLSSSLSLFPLGNLVLF